MIYKSRMQAGQILASYLTDYQNDKDSIVVGLPRGGVAVAAEVAHRLHLPLDVVLLRKLPYPFQPELAVGAVAENGAVFVNEEFRQAAREDPSWLEEIVREQQEVIRHRALSYRSHRHGRDPRGKTVILVDDGVATGATMRVAVRAMRAAGANRVVVAVPVAAGDSVRVLQSEADEVVCVEMPADFHAVGQAYEIFDQVSDQEVISLLDRHP